eukprot:806735-Rhodomonas_salina.1
MGGGAAASSGSIPAMTASVPANNNFNGSFSNSNAGHASASVTQQPQHAPSASVPNTSQPSQGLPPIDPMEYSRCRL